MDRNLLWGCRDSIFERVALRKESVDRNREIVVPAPTVMIVALRKESVDRNADTMLNT